MMLRGKVLQTKTVKTANGQPEHYFFLFLYVHCQQETAVEFI